MFNLIKSSIHVVHLRGRLSYHIFTSLRNFADERFQPFVFQFGRYLCANNNLEE